MAAEKLDLPLLEEPSELSALSQHPCMHSLHMATSCAGETWLPCCTLQACTLRWCTVCRLTTCAGDAASRGVPPRTAQAVAAAVPRPRSRPPSPVPTGADTRRLSLAPTAKEVDTDPDGLVWAGYRCPADITLAEHNTLTQRWLVGGCWSCSTAFRRWAAMRHSKRCAETRDACHCRRCWSRSDGSVNPCLHADVVATACLRVVALGNARWQQRDARGRTEKWCASAARVRGGSVHGQRRNPGMQAWNPAVAQH